MRTLLTVLGIVVLLAMPATALDRPIGSIPQDVFIEGTIDGTYVGTTPAIMVNGVKIFVISTTVIKIGDSYGKFGDLRVGTKVSVYGYGAKGGVMARSITVHK